MFASTGDLILFAVKAGLKLGRQGKIAYAEATINREITLPLPNFHPEVTIGVADGYFAGTGKKYLEGAPLLEKIHRKSMAGDTLSEDEEKKYLEYYIDCKREDDIEAGRIKGDKIGLTTEALLSLVRVRQWALKKSPYPSVYQRVLGSLIEIGVDYCAGSPLLADEASAAGKALRGFLDSVDHLDFATEQINTLARKLFLAALESIEGNPDLLGADVATQQLVHAAASGLIEDINRHVRDVGDVDLTREEAIFEWGQLLLRSILSNMGETVFENPSLYLPVHGAGEQALVSAAGETILDLVVENDAIDFQNLFSRKALDRLVKASLNVVAEHPSMLGIDNQGIKKILSAVLKEFATPKFEFAYNRLPEIMRIILEKTAINADLIWPYDFNDPEKHLRCPEHVEGLIVTAGELLEELAKPPANGSKWRPRLSGNQVMHVLEVALDEVANHPQWLLDMADGADSYLGIAVRAATKAISGAPGKILTPTTVQAVIEDVIKAIARRIEYLDRVKIDGKEATIIEHALDAIVGSILAEDVDKKARWALARKGIFEIVVGIVFAQLESEGISAGNVKLVRKALLKAVDQLSSGKSWSISDLVDELVLTMEGETDDR